MKNILVLLILIALVSSLGCSSCKKNITDRNGLPPATQNGSKTLGFLLNGQPWTPQGFNGTANLSMDIDFGYQNGEFNIAAYQIKTTDNRAYFGLSVGDSLNYIVTPASFSLTQNSLFGVYFSCATCTYDYFDQSIYRSGHLLLTKLDKTNRIISGTFEATLYKSGCDTIKITGGRFDMSY